MVVLCESIWDSRTVWNAGHGPPRQQGDGTIKSHTAMQLKDFEGLALVAVFFLTNLTFLTYTILTISCLLLLFFSDTQSSYSCVLCREWSSPPARRRARPSCSSCCILTVLLLFFTNTQSSYSCLVCRPWSSPPARRRERPSRSGTLSSTTMAPWLSSRCGCSETPALPCLLL